MSWVPNNIDELERANKIKSWVSASGQMKKSYKHTFKREFDYYKLIDLYEQPRFVRNSPIKHQLNQEFRESYPFLDMKLTLSKLNNLRDTLVERMCRYCDIDIHTLALAFAYF